MAKATILIVDDEPSIRRGLGASLREEGYKVLEAVDGSQALKVIDDEYPDLMVLDITMPELDGYEVCRRVREWSQIPIIMLSAKANEQDKVRCLNLGADDYVVKPFGVDEMIARIDALFRRTRASTVDSGGITFADGGLEINFSEMRVTVNGQGIQLTATEFNLLRELVLNRGKVLTHGMLLKQVWGPDYGDEKEYVRVFVRQLRQKIGDDSSNPHYIKTVRGVGYRFLDSSQTD